MLFVEILTDSINTCSALLRDRNMGLGGKGTGDRAWPRPGPPFACSPTRVASAARPCSVIVLVGQVYLQGAVTHAPVSLNKEPVKWRAGTVTGGSPGRCGRAQSPGPGQA